MRRPTTALILIALLTPGLAACGGGGGGDAAPPTTELVLPSDDPLDGQVTRDADGLKGSAVVEPAVGVLETSTFGRTFRGIYSFDLPDLAGARIVSAELSLYQRFVQGSPYSKLGALVVDHIDMGATFNTAAWAAFTIATIRDANGKAVPISTTSSLGRKTLDVTAQVAADIRAGRVRSQYRVRFDLDAPDGVLGNDVVNLTSVKAVPFVAPQLILTYVAP